MNEDGEGDGTRGATGVILTTTLRGERFVFEDLRTLFARANEEKSGDRLAGIAAPSERARVAAKCVLAELSLAEIVDRPLIDPDHDVGLLVQFGDLRPEGFDRRIFRPEVALQLAKLSEEFGTLTVQLIDRRAGQRLSSGAARVPRSVLRLGRRARRASSSQLRTELRQLASDQRLFGGIIGSPRLDIDQTLLLRISDRFSLRILELPSDLVKAVLQELTCISRSLETPGEAGFNEILGDGVCSAGVGGSVGGNVQRGDRRRWARRLSVIMLH